MPPPRRSNSGAIVAVVLAGVFLFGVGTIGMFAVVADSDSDDSASDYTSTYESTSYDDSTSATYSSTVSTSSTDTSTSDYTSSETTTSTPSGPQPVVALGNHPINTTGSGAQTTSCDLPEFATDNASQDAFYQAAAPCLMQAWAPALKAANLPVETPNIITTDSDVSTPCGNRSWNKTALYCTGNHTIYMTSAHYAEVEGQTEAGVFLGQFAHEFGHAVQGLAGIMDGKANAVYDTGGSDTAEGLEVTRRSELQATCFEGMSLAALQNGGVSNEYIFPALRDSEQRGDMFNPQPDHGSVETNHSWVNQGFKRNTVSDCNTWLSASSDVD